MCKKDIIKQFPSLCWKCVYARNTPKSLLYKGFCGCIYLLKEKGMNVTEDNSQNWIPYLSNIVCSEIYSGWVMTRQLPFDDEKDEYMFNFTPQVKCCKECKFFINLK